MSNNMKVKYSKSSIQASMQINVRFKGVSCKCRSGGVVEVCRIGVFNLSDDEKPKPKLPASGCLQHKATKQPCYLPTSKETPLVAAIERQRIE